MCHEKNAIAGILHELRHGDDIISIYKRRLKNIVPTATGLWSQTE